MAVPAHRIEEAWASSPFGAYAPARHRRSRHWLISVLVSSAIYGSVIAAIVLFAGSPVVRVAQKIVDVTFVEKIAKPEPPPPPAPPPKPVEKPQPPPAAAAPVIPPHQTVRRLEKPPPPKPMVAPRRMPKEPPPEAKPEEDKGIAVQGEGDKQDPAGLEGGTTQGGVVGGVAGGAIELPDDAIPPRPKSSNVIPPYPQEARADGRTGVVVLEIVILADGSVDHVRVVRGDEPFASAAVDAVKTWKYEPARFKGQPISVYKTFSVTFKLA
jgi:periplasmic protein TonB